MSRARRIRKTSIGATRPGRIRRTEAAGRGSTGTTASVARALLAPVPGPTCGFARVARARVERLRARDLHGTLPWLGPDGAGSGAAAGVAIGGGEPGRHLRE